MKRLGLASNEGSNGVLNVALAAVVEVASGDCDLAKLPTRVGVDGAAATTGDVGDGVGVAFLTSRLDSALPLAITMRPNVYGESQNVLIVEVAAVASNRTDLLSMIELCKSRIFSPISTRMAFASRCMFSQFFSDIFNSPPLPRSNSPSHALT